MQEHAIIATHFAPLCADEPGSFNLTDDAAVLAMPEGKRLVVTTDSVIEGVHMLPAATEAQYASKLMRRNLSDLAAMGAAPWRYFLNLRVPRETGTEWFASFAATLHQEQERFGLVLAGGDTTLGGDIIHLSATVLGLVGKAPLTRSGACAGDGLYVTGSIGDAALGLAMLQADAAADGHWIDRYHLPQPRLQVGQALCGVASAALDCSDGLLKDAARLAMASGVGLELDATAIPVSDATRSLLEAAPDYASRSAIRQIILTGGDDYELIFTAPPSAETALAEMARFLRVPITPIGTVTDAGLEYRDEAGQHRFGLDSGWEY